MNNLIKFKNYISLLTTKIMQQKENINLAAYNVDKVREELIKIVKEREILDKLKEKKYEAYLQEQLKAEQRLNDEIISYRHADRHTGEGKWPKDKKDSVQSKDGSAKGKGVVFMLLTFFIAILAIGIVFGGAFYIVVHNNINGLGERYRKTLQNIPVVKLALPEVPDPLDSRYMTADEIAAKYEEFKKLNEDLTRSLEESKKAQEELQKYKDEYDKYKAENDKAAQEIKDKTAALDDRQLKLDELQKKIEKLIADGDKTGF